MYSTKHRRSSGTCPKKSSNTCQRTTYSFESGLWSRYFYNFFSMKQREKSDKVCLRTACYVKGADKILERLQDELNVEMNEPTSDGLFSIHAVRCLVLAVWPRLS